MANTKEKMCPLLTAGVLKMQEQPVVDGVTDASPRDAMTCQGAVCAFWMPIADEHGHMTKDGNCAIPLAAVALSQMNVQAHAHKSKIVKG